MGTLSIRTPDQRPRAAVEDSSLDGSPVYRARRSEERDRGVRRTAEEGHGEDRLRSSGRASERPRNDLDRDPGRGARSFQGRGEERKEDHRRASGSAVARRYGQASPAQIFLSRRTGLASGDQDKRRGEPCRSGCNRGRVEIRSGSRDKEPHSR